MGADSERSERSSLPSRSSRSDSQFGENFRTGAVTVLMDFSQWFQIKATPVLRKFDWALIRACVLILALSFVLASSVSTFAANFALNSVIPKTAKTGKALPAKTSKTVGKGALNSKGSTGKLESEVAEPAPTDDNFQIRAPMEAQTSNKEGP